MCVLVSRSLTYPSAPFWGETDNIDDFPSKKKVPLSVPTLFALAENNLTPSDEIKTVK